MTFKSLSCSPRRMQTFSRLCAFAVLALTVTTMRSVFHHLPILGIIVFAGFKLGSMFYVAGRLIEFVWSFSSRLTVRAVSGVEAADVVEPAAEVANA
jgi:hypothetical protein